MLKNHVIQNTSKLLQNRIDHIPPGGSVRNLPRKFLPARFRKPGYFDFYSGNNCYKRLSHDDVAPTVLASTGDNSLLIHPSLNRLLSLRETARLQTFPDDYEFTGSYSAVHKQIGNAVPCLLARQLGKSLKDWCP